MTDNDRRHFLKTAGVTLAGAVGALTGISAGAEEKILTREEMIRRIGDIVRGGGPLPLPNPPRAAVAASPKGTTRKELVERLQKLAESKPPTDLDPGAMCYDMISPEKVEKPCPDCGRTMTVGEMEEFLSKYNVPLKRLQSQSLDAKLIFPEHCPTCGFGLESLGMAKWSKNEWEKRRLQLEIKYPDHPTPVRAVLDGAYELEIMVLFLQGSDRWGNGVERAMKDEVDRLKKLFGLK